MGKNNHSPRAEERRRDDADFGVRAGYLMHDVSRLRRAFFDEAMRPHGLTPSQWWVLAQLGRRRGRPVSQVELAKSLDMGKAALGGLIDRLEAAGYVRRDASEDDRRVKLVAPTDRGLHMTDAMRRVGHELNLRVFAGLSDEEVAALEGALARIKANLLALSHAPDAPEAGTTPAGANRA
ncbi:MarR family winged helix-turn-helix transcriptional regulator [Enterovirga sp. CN4-39]|uniref:MarR family winged helix-turn-helix transcriptional regulator n=1 Tax=Enterovirga sp. CN4-39 TaxID=3400910 RepID=UPI003BFC34B7